MTVEEFLRWDDGTDTRYELIDGEVVAMAPAADRHGRIATNVAVEIDRRLESRPPCSAVVEAGIWINDEDYFEADVAATCADPSDSIAVRDPFLIVEIISPSNTRDRMMMKIQAYMQLGTVQEIWLIDSTRRWVQHWRRADADSWVVTLPLTGSASFDSPSLRDRIALDRLYRNTGL